MTKKLTDEELLQWHKDTGLTARKVMEHIAALTEELTDLRVFKTINHDEALRELKEAREQAGRYRSCLELCHQELSESYDASRAATFLVPKIFDVLKGEP